MLWNKESVCVCVYVLRGGSTLGQNCHFQIAFFGPIYEIIGHDMRPMLETSIKKSYHVPTMHVHYMGLIL